MKTKSIIIGMAVLVVYGLTVAISWDQVKSANADKVRIGKDLKTTQDELRGAKAGLKKAEQDAAEWRARAVELAGSTQKLIAAQKTIDDANAAKIRLLEARSAPAIANTGGLNRQAVSPQFQIPRWIPQPTVIVTKAIKDKALAKYGSDFSAANYEIERQTEAYEKLVRFQRMNNVFVTELLNKTMFERGDDYSGAVYEIERQIEAKQKVESK